MRQYTTPDQTAKLIELGFEKPINTVVKEEPIYREGFIIDWKPIAEEGSYSIGELMEMLPECEIIYTGIWNNVKYDEEHYYGRRELVDALYFLIIELKNERVI